MCSTEHQYSDIAHRHGMMAQPSMSFLRLYKYYQKTWDVSKSSQKAGMKWRMSKIHQDQSVISRVIHQTVCPHWGVLTVGVKARCLIRVLQLGPRYFSCKFLYKVALVKWLDLHLTAQARTKSVSAFWAQSGARHFSCKFRSKVALLNFWLAFRLRRLAQSLCVCVCVLDSIRGAAFFLNNPYKVTLVKSHSAFRLSSLGLSCCQSHLRNMLLRLTVSFEQPSRIAIVVLTE